MNIIPTIANSIFIFLIARITPKATIQNVATNNKAFHAFLLDEVSLGMIFDSFDIFLKG